MTAAMRRLVGAIMTFAAIALGVSRARAESGEAVRFAAHSSPRCATRDDVVAQIEALGARLREPREDERARRLELTIERGDTDVDVRLVVHDLVGRITERHVKSRDCREAATAASLLVVLALDEAQPERETVPDASRNPTGDWARPLPTEHSYWPAPVRDDGGPPGVRLVPAGRIGSGGVFLAGAYGTTGELRAFQSVRAIAVARVWDSTRIGVGLTLSRDSRRADGGERIYETGGWSGRAGVAFAWGAPWDDSAVGFATEVGVAVGKQQGTTYREIRSARSCVYGDCLESVDRRVLSDSFASPYGSWSLLFQVPFKKSKVRPVAGITASLIPLAPHAILFEYSWTLGLVWQAW